MQSPIPSGAPPPSHRDRGSRSAACRPSARRDGEAGGEVPHRQRRPRHNSSGLCRHNSPHVTPTQMEGTGSPWQPPVRRRPPDSRGRQLGSSVRLRGRGEAAEVAARSGRTEGAGGTEAPSAGLGVALRHCSHRGGSAGPLCATGSRPGSRWLETSRTRLRSGTRVAASQPHRTLGAGGGLIADGGSALGTGHSFEGPGSPAGLQTGRALRWGGTGTALPMERQTQPQPPSERSRNSDTTRRVMRLCRG